MFCMVSVCAQTPSTDLLLFEMDWSEEYRPILKSPVWVTERDGYDNQPSFAPDNSYLLYTSLQGDQTDIFRYTIGSGVTDRMTETKLSEYSPQVMPSGKHFSVVRVEGEGPIQRVWRFSLKKPSAKPRLLMDQVNPVGYYAWQQKYDIGMFILGDKNTLQICDSRKQNINIVAYNIGRCLQPVPGESAISFMVKEDVRSIDAETEVQPEALVWPIRKYNFDTKTVTDICAAVPNSEDYAWTPDGRIIMARGNKLYILNPGGENRWRLVSDLSGMGISSLTRIAVSADNRYLCLVAAR